MRNNLFLGVAAVALIAPMAASAQETTSSIRGTVTSNGAPVAGATVVVTTPDTGTRSTATTNESGTFNLNGLRAGGPYTVSVSAPGFGSTQITDINTTVAQAFDLPVELAADTTGSADEVVVTASRLPNARSISQGPTTVLNARQIANIATVNRDIRDLERRDPFARLDDSPSGGRSVSFAGQNARYNRFTVDGVSVSDNFGLNSDGLPSRRSPIPLDAIGQFQAQVAPYDVRQGNFQGGAINIVLKSGTNDFHGTGFYSQSRDEWVGKRTKDLRVSVPNFKTENYGAELSGPIIKDKLFFMVAGERLRGGRPIAEGPTDNNAGTSIPGITQAQVDQISAIAKSVYNYDTGGVLRDLGDKDDRVVAKIDANLSDTQRLSLTYTYANDAINLLQNTFPTAPTGLGLASNAYIQGNRLHTGVAQLNSQWSDNFSTEVRGFYKNYTRIQDPLMGRGFAQFRVCTNPTSTVAAPGAAANTVSPSACENNAGTVSFGPDSSRQTNQLKTETWGGLVQARLTMNDHDVRVFGEVSSVSIFNSFLQNSSGSYYFDSIADLQNRFAGSLAYGNAIIPNNGLPALDPNAAAASFGYQSYTFGVMDSWKVTPTLNLSYGARYDLYAMDDNPALSTAFESRYANGAIVNGQRVNINNNTANISGFGLFQPRAGFDWKPAQRVSIRGGGGIFGGGTPDVYVSNSFSNTGVLTNSFSVSRTVTGFNGFPTGTAAGVQASTAAALLTGVTGTAVPAAANTFLTGGSVPANSTVNALDPNFKIPSQWRATLTGEYTANLGFLGDDWVFGADLLYSKVRNQVYFTDIRSVPIAGSLTPDGRQRYQNLIDGGAASTNTSSDILLTNTDKGRAYIGVARLEKAWDSGLSINASFTYQDVKDAAPATSSTAGSNYSNGAFADPNNVAYGISNDQVKYFFKYGVNYDHAFFGDYKTTFALFGESRVGHPFSYTFQDFGNNGGGRASIFGTTGVSSNSSTGGNRYLLYVPTVDDAKVSYSSAAVRNAVNQFIDATSLKKYRGQIAPRNAFHSKWFTRLDLHVAQEIPTFLGGSRVTVFADIENFTNFINKNWGQQREYVFPYNTALIRAQCLTTPGNADGAGTIATTVGQACAQYRYSPVGGGATFTPQADQVYVNQSLYSIRIGARFTF
ncbi:carboxypeptidase regulatory-like domain-containing protein [Sphingomonas sp. R86521]|uniref:TonB-dependent receptor n=1 Tax=Sphingomonas sp. R86521 TaxID=3093860 RepID=UPI0036D31B03